jgi:hypothetical protein
MKPQEPAEPIEPREYLDDLVRQFYLIRQNPARPNETHSKELFLEKLSVEIQRVICQVELEFAKNASPPQA